MDDKKMEDALDSFVESLKREQENGKLVENNNWKETPKAEENHGLEKLERIIKKVVEIICIGEDVRVESDITGYENIGLWPGPGDGYR
ncbi:MAG: hypothetical protein U5N58_12215 [Actinomycetota bacterium]|nr:hypothetical protein [Actinomycetota bacterium]